MALLLEVKWVQKSNDSDPYLRIHSIGGESGYMKWGHTQDQAIEAIEKKVFQYFVKRGVDILRIEIGLTPQGLKYLKTQTDINQPINLMRLPGNPE